jgi:CRP/FNR family transcriptional regulator
MDALPDAAGAAVPLHQRIAALYPELPMPPQAGRGEAPYALPAPLQVPAGVVLFQESSPCGGFPLVLSGEVRVARGTPGGRSIELYRVVPGEICVVSAASLFGQAVMPAHGMTAIPTELVLLSPQTFEAWSAHGPFRRHVFGLFAGRLADVISLAEAVAFQRLDQRLAAALLGRGTVLGATHQSLADELGTVREMVTRLLRRFERAGWVALGRERIEVLDAAALRRAAQGTA